MTSLERNGDIMWRDVPNYEGLYKINTEGVINRVYLNFERALKPYRASNGYARVTLCKNGRQEYKNIHRLMAEIFIPNPENKPEVNHIDGNRFNFSLDNLEWVTRHRPVGSNSHIRWEHSGPDP